MPHVPGIETRFANPTCPSWRSQDPTNRPLFTLDSANNRCTQLHPQRPCHRDQTVLVVTKPFTAALVLGENEALLTQFLHKVFNLRCRGQQGRDLLQTTRCGRYGEHFQQTLLICHLPEEAELQHRGQKDGEVLQAAR